MSILSPRPPVCHPLPERTTQAFTFYRKLCEAGGSCFQLFVHDWIGFALLLAVGAMLPSMLLFIYR